MEVSVFSKAAAAVSGSPNPDIAVRPERPCYSSIVSLTRWAMTAGLSSSSLEGVPVPRHQLAGSVLDVRDGTKPVLFWLEQPIPMYKRLMQTR